MVCVQASLLHAPRISIKLSRLDKNKNLQARLFSDPVQTLPPSKWPFHLHQQPLVGLWYLCLQLPPHEIVIWYQGFGTSVCSCPLMRVSFASLLVLTIQVMNSSPGPGRLKLSTGQGLPCCVTWIVSSAYVPSCRAASCQPLTSRHLQKLSLVAVICLPRCHPLFPWTAAPVKVSEGL